MNHMGRWKISEKLEGWPRALEAPGPQGPPAARATGMQGLGGPGSRAPGPRGSGPGSPGSRGSGPGQGRPGLVGPAVDRFAWLPTFFSYVWNGPLQTLVGSKEVWNGPFQTLLGPKEVWNGPFQTRYTLCCGPQKFGTVGHFCDKKTCSNSTIS